MGQPHSGLPILGILALTLAPFSFLLPLFSLPRVCPLRPLPRSLAPSDPLTPDRYIIFMNYEFMNSYIK